MPFPPRLPAAWQKALTNPVPPALLALALALLSGTAQAQGKPAANAAAAGKAALAECVADLRQAASNAADAQEAARKRVVLSAVQVARLQAMDTPVARLRDSIKRGPRSVAECEQWIQSLAEEQERFERFGVAEATAAAAEPAAPARTTTSAAVAPAAAAATVATAPAVTAPAVTAAPAMPVDPRACREAQARSYNEVAQIYTRMVSSANVRPEWVATLNGLSQRLTQLHDSIADTAAPGWDCARVAQGLAQAKSDLEKLGR